MASQPPQQFPPRQPSSQQQSSAPTPSSEATSSQPQRRSSIPQSTTSEDSQTVFLNHPSSSDPSPTPESQNQRQISPRPKPRTAQSTKEPKKCWICFGDETEDSPTTSEWRSPCPCALTAHEACLLDWVADLEAPSSRKKQRKIECPQCKSKITIARPWSPVVDGFQAIERAVTRMALPFTLVTLAGTVITGCWMHGLSTVYLIFGREDADRVLGIHDGFRMSSNWGVTLPIIPIALVFSRTTHLDNLFPIIPIFYFASGAPRHDRPLWPPSAAFTLASLPYIRAVYNELWSRVLAPKEKAWMQEIQPRGGENGEGEGEGQGQEQNQEGGGNGVEELINIELDVEVEVVEDGEADGHQQQPEQGAENAPAADQGPGEVEQGQNQNQDQNQNQNQPPNQQGNQPQPADHAVNVGGAGAGAGANIILDVLASAQLVVGALVLPSVSAAMGVLLKTALPRTWTTPPGRWDRYPVGFLQSRFGRTMVGGCLFIALKDTLTFYSKYRLAQDHKHRRILNYDPKKAKKSKKPTS